jgi:hypothetical protein
LRYFENRSAAETAALLGIEAWAAHKRTARAVEKLLVFFARRGIAVSAGSLTGAISGHSVQAAPAALQSLAWALTHNRMDRAQQLMQWDEKGVQFADPALQRELRWFRISLPPSAILRRSGFCPSSKLTSQPN